MPTTEGVEPIPMNSLVLASSSPPTSRNSSSSSLEESSDETPPRKVKSLREIYESCQLALFVLDPITFVEATTKEEWKNAMKEEFVVIQKNETWEMMELLKGKNAIGLKWVFKIKFHVDRSIQKHKAWLVAKGYSQQQGIDFEETFSPIA